MTNSLYSESDTKREFENDDSLAPWRKPFARDYARLIHCSSFRRLQGKTQVFPGHESDFFRNRLTHSLEVAQIAEGIAERLNYEFPCFNENQIDGKLCAATALMHDLGHPPFGHNGERALDQSMIKHGGFEGNAQTLRIISRLEKKVRDEGDAYGLNLTYRSLASILKYDKKIPRSRNEGDKLKKGYYASEADLVKKIKTAVASEYKVSEGKFKTIECSIMDLADDIAYSTYDLEDSFKAGFLTPADILSSNEQLLNEVATKVTKELRYEITPVEVLKHFTDIFSDLNFGPDDGKSEEMMVEFAKRYRASKALAGSGYFRTQFSSQLVGEGIKAVKVEFNEKCPALSKVYLEKEVQERVEVLKQYTYVATIYSSRVKLPEYRGYEVVKGIFDALSSDRGDLLMPQDVREEYAKCGDELDEKMRIICDFVAGMTDRYAMEFYGRLHSDSAQSMFKPI